MGFPSSTKTVSSNWRELAPGRQASPSKRTTQGEVCAQWNPREVRPANGHSCGQQVCWRVLMKESPCQLQHPGARQPHSSCCFQTATLLNIKLSFFKVKNESNSNYPSCPASPLASKSPNSHWLRTTTVFCFI